MTEHMSNPHDGGRQERNARLDGKVAVITGGGGGIGRATALVLAKAGATVVVAGRRMSGCEATAEAVRSAAGAAHPTVVDVADWNSARHLADETHRLAGPADVVVANAGVAGPAGRSWEVSPSDWMSNVQINLVGVFNTVRAFLPGMVQRRQGILVLVSSVAVKLTVPGWGAYTSSKSGVDHLARVMQAEFDAEELPLRVHVAYPGAVATSMQEVIRSFPEAEFPNVGVFRRMHEKGRLRSPDEPASLIWWLTTPMAADLRGRVADIDDPEIQARVSADLGMPPL